MASLTVNNSVLKNSIRAIKTVVSSKKFVEGAGLVVRRPLGAPEFAYCDPFLMLDHVGPVEYSAGEQAVGAPDHPHRGFETVSYILSGGFQHKDSRGNQGDLQAGDVQWMTAGSGVVHSEMPSDELMKNGGLLEGFQLWVNLPKKDKMIAPRYQDIRSANIPELILNSADATGKVRVMAGQAGDVKAVIDTRTPITYLDVQLQKAGSRFETAVPAEYNGFIYVYRGVGKFGAEHREGSMGQILELGPGTHASVESVSDDCRALIIAGVPLNEPIARAGPFVMNTQSEIRQAFVDFHSGKMGAIDGAAERSRQAAQALAKSGGPVTYT